MADERPCVLVIGMHRSGTSATAGTLAALGLATATGDDLASPRTSNERGYFESNQMMLVNRRLLFALGGTWSGPPRLLPGWETDHALDDLRIAASTAFAERFPSRPMVWKDPRNCITLPFWRGVITPPLAAVFVYRDPIEVARSLRVRNDVGLTYGLALWDRYVRAACTNLVGLPTMVVDYARILREPSAWIEELVDFLGGIGVETDATKRDTAVASLDAGLRHHHPGHDQAPGLSNSQFEVIAALRHLDGPNASWVAPDFGPEPDWVDDVLALRLAADELRIKLHRLERQTSRTVRAVRRLGRLRRNPTEAPTS